MAQKKVYKTAGGKEIDFQKLLLKNEETRAVGNMNVNARGDILDSDNKKTSARSAQVNKQYRKQTHATVRDMPVVNSKKAAQAMAEQYVNSTPAKDAEVKNVIAGLDDPVVEENIPVETKVVSEDEAVENAPTGGLAEAIAKAREIKQEPLKTEREEARSKDGVKKI